MKRFFQTTFLFFLSICSVFAQGTYLVKDIIAGTNSSMPTNLVKAGDLVYFTAAAPGTNNGFYKTDGTEAGTQFITTIAKRTPYDPYKDKNTLDYNGKLLFTKFSDVTSNVEELWVTDGTEAGTKSIAVYPRVNELTLFNNYVYFVVDQSFNEARGLYKWDGTNAPVKLVGGDDLNDGLNFSIVGDENQLFFSDGWRIYNVTTDNAEIIYNQSTVDNTVTGIGTVAFYNGEILLTEGRGIEGGSIRGIRALDPSTKQNSYVLEKIGLGGPTNQGATMAPMGSDFYFSKTYSKSVGGGNSISYYELWKIAPSFRATMVKQIEATKSITIRYITANTNLLLFLLDYSSSGYELWKSDGTETGTEAIISLQDSVIIPIEQNQTYINDTSLFFIAKSNKKANTSGSELWISDFTKSGTSMAVDFNDGTSGGTGFSNLVSLKPGSVLITANRKTNTGSPYGAELWSSDGGPFKISSGLSEIKNQQYKIYPNPAVNYITIENIKEEIKVFIYNNIGQLIAENILDTGNKTIDLDGLKPGIYVVKMHSANYTGTSKLIVSE